MLKKRIVISAIVFGLSLPSLSQAAPLSWMPGPDVVAKLTRLWDLLPGVHHASAARPARDLRKNGCGMDPNGTPCAPAPGPYGSTTPADPGGDTGR